MHSNLQPLTPKNSNGSPTTDLTALVEQIWRDLNGQAQRARIYQVAATVAADFDQATVTSFVPIFIRRETLEKLRTEAVLKMEEA